MGKTSAYVEFDVSESPVGATPSKGSGPNHGQEEPRPLIFSGAIGTMGGYNRFYGDLFDMRERGENPTAGEMAALFNAFLLSKLPIGRLTKAQAKNIEGLSQPQRERLHYLFHRVGYGNVCATVIDYDSGDKLMAKRKYTDRRVLWIDNPLLVVENGVIKRIKGGEAHRKIVPAPGYVGWTQDGACDEDGAPFETWEKRSDAEQTWLDRGEDSAFARDAVSYWNAREEGEGKAIIGRRFLNYDSGRFFLDADLNPSGAHYRVGRIPVRRQLTTACQTPPPGDSQKRQLVVTKGPDVYIFRYNHGDEVSLFYSLMQYATDDRFNFDLKDLVQCTSRLLRRQT